MLEASVDSLRRGFVAVWILLALAGALKLGTGGHLVLPHLRYGHVMFNQNLRTVRVYHYAGADGVRRPLADLMTTPSLGYHRARLGMNLIIKPDYMLELCLRTLRQNGNQPFTILTDEYDIERDARTPARTIPFACEPSAFAPR
jgi:hypothetical protein